MTEGGVSFGHRRLRGGWAAENPKVHQGPPRGPPVPGTRSLFSRLSGPQASYRAWGLVWFIYEYGVVDLQTHLLSFSVYSKNTFDSYSFEIAAFTTTAFDMYPCIHIYCDAFSA